MMRWWLDRGVDGFRMDVINMLSKDTALPDAPGGDGSPYYISGPRIHEFLQEMHREVFAGRDGLLTVGEMPGVTVEDARLFTDPARGEVDMVFQFEHVQLDQGGSKWEVMPLRLRDLKRSLGRWQTGLADMGWNSLYWDNHDQPRAVSRFGDDSPEHRVRAAKMLATVLHLHRGTPYVYQGEELGMTNFPFASIADFRDIESLNHHAEAGDAAMDALRAMSRDNARTPVQWDASEHAGFTTGEPWIAVNPNHAEINAQAQRDDPDSVLHHYRAVIALRHSEPAVVHGDFTMLLEEDERIYAFARRHEDTELLVLGNFSGEAVTVDLPDWADAEIVLGEPGDGLRTVGGSRLPALLPVILQPAGAAGLLEELRRDLDDEEEREDDQRVRRDRRQLRRGDEADEGRDERQPVAHAVEDTLFGVRDVQIRGEMIRLGQLLKLAGVIDSSGEAKAYLASAPVLVNGEAEARRGRQLHSGDEVQAGEEHLRVVG